MSWSNIIDIGMGIGSLASANRANNEAERLNALTEAQVTADINRNQEVADLYAGGADVMSNNLNRLLTEYGDFGQITPSIINDFSTFVSTNRAQEEAANRREVDGLTSYDRARLRGMEDMYREFSDVKLEEGRDEVYYQDEKAKLVAPQTLQFAQMQDSLLHLYQ